MKSRTAVLLVVVALVAAVVGVAVGRSLGGGLAAVAREAGLSTAQARGALKSVVAPGKMDPYLMISSGGHGGQVLVYGLPSMRLLKQIAVFTPEPWQGYGYGADWGEKLLDSGGKAADGGNLTWADTHHPAISETKGSYDGRWAYVNDKANGRIAMIDLRDFKVKQLVKVPNIDTSHGGVFVTPNTEYVHMSSYTPMPWTESGYAPLEDYKTSYRGASTFLKPDETGKFDLSRSFQIELPPYTQDLADAGKGASFGLGFINSNNVEMCTGGPGNYLEACAVKAAYDYLHVIDWQKAEKLVEAGRTVDRNGMRVLPLATAAEEGVLTLVPELKNPHGVDISPDGRWIVVSGKLDPHVTIYSAEKLKKAIADKKFEGRDEFGVPIVALKDVQEAQVEVGAGPLHTQFDNKGNAYTSLFVETSVAKWSLGGGAGTSWKLLDKIKVHYNIGHLATAEGDTATPQGDWLVALNKWSIDRFARVGPLHPQNLQLIGISGSKMELLADSPAGTGEPHYAQIIKTSRIKALTVYKPGTDILTFEPSPNAIEAGKERVERDGSTVHVYMTAMRSHFTPDVLRVKRGDTVVLHVTNIEQAEDATHGFGVPDYNINLSLDPGETTTVEFKAEKPGAFAFYCTEFCSALHMEMQGWLLVEPA